MGQRGGGLESKHVGAEMRSTWLKKRSAVPPFPLAAMQGWRLLLLPALLVQVLHKIRLLLCLLWHVKAHGGA